MTKKRAGEPRMSADDYGRSLPRFTVNLLVKDVARSVAFYTGVFGARAHYSDRSEERRVGKECRL